MRSEELRSDEVEQLTDDQIDKSKMVFSFGDIDEEQSLAVAEVVNGKTVYDAGAGNLMLSLTVSSMGARKVFAIDKNERTLLSPYRQMFKDRDCIEIRNEDFRETLKYVNERKEKIDVLFVSWPENHLNHALIALMMRSEVVIYLGKNTDGLMCGHPQMFGFLLTLDVIKYIPSKRNTLIIYGKTPFGGRCAFPEEIAAIRAGSKMGEMLSYEEAEHGTKDTSKA